MVCSEPVTDQTQFSYFCNSHLQRWSWLRWTSIVYRTLGSRGIGSSDAEMAGTVVGICSAEAGVASLNRACTVREQRSAAASFGVGGRISAGRLSLGSVRKCSTIRNVAMQDLLPGMDGDGSVGEARDYPAGMQRYESMVVLRPDLTEDERVALTERYEEVSVHSVG